MKLRLALLAGAAVLGLAAVGPAGAAEIVDRDVSAPTLKVDRSGKTALVSYRKRSGKVRHVLYWGARDWATRFSRDYSGGWGSRKADWKTFRNACGPYTGPELDLLVAACTARDGSHWALQSWERLWRNYGGRSAREELYLSHWTGDVGVLEIKADWSYNGRFEHLWGTFTYHGKAVFGNAWTSTGVPLDKHGRNIYLDYARSGTWRRENSFLTHPVNAGFCYGFYRHQGRVGTGSAYRATVIGPGVTPLVRLGFSPPGPFDRALDEIANEEQRALFAEDFQKGSKIPRCKIN